MAADAITIARPYAEAVFARAEESGKLDQWSEMLSFLSLVVADPAVSPVVSNPLVDRQALTDLLLEIGGEHINDEGGNLVRLLVQNGRLALVPEIKSLFEELKAEKQRILSVHVTSAFALKPEQEKTIAEALKAKLGRDVTISSEKDTTLIGGVHLQQLANELGI
ncbi:MAG: F0F1 ATP synthase subunit delta [Candidatus Thiodiazotropha sp.]